MSTSSPCQLETVLPNRLASRTAEISFRAKESLFLAPACLEQIAGMLLLNPQFRAHLHLGRDFDFSIFLFFFLWWVECLPNGELYFQRGIHRQTVQVGFISCTQCGAHVSVRTMLVVLSWCLASWCPLIIHWQTSGQSFLFTHFSRTASAQLTWKYAIPFPSGRCHCTPHPLLLSHVISFTHNTFHPLTLPMKCSHAWGWVLSIPYPTLWPFTSVLSSVKHG